MKSKKVDEDQYEAGQLEKFEYQIIQESEKMPKEEIVDEINKLLKKMPKRNLAQIDRNILQNYKYDVEKEGDDQENKSVIDFFNAIPKERIDYYDMTESFEDFTPTQLESEDLYFKDKLKNTKTGRLMIKSLKKEKESI